MFYWCKCRLSYTRCCLVSSMMQLDQQILEVHQRFVRPKRKQASGQKEQQC